MIIVSKLQKEDAVILRHVHLAATRESVEYILRTPASKMTKIVKEIYAVSVIKRRQTVKFSELVSFDSLIRYLYK